MIFIETFLKKFNRVSFRETPKVLIQAWDKFVEIKHAQSEEVQELLYKLLQDLQSINEELAEYINTPSWNLPTSFYDDDDDEYSFATQEYLMTCSTAITLDSPKTNSLIMEDEHFDTIPETESDEFIKSSSHLVSFSNPLFDINDDCTSSNDESFSEEDIPMENFKFFSNPLYDLDEEIVSTEVNLIQNEVLESITSIPPGIDSFYAESNLIESLLNQNTSIISSPKIDSLLEQFASELTLLKSFPPGIDEAKFDPEEDISLIKRLLYDNSSPRPPKELNMENYIESFPPSYIPVEDSDPFMEEIDLFLASDESIPPGIDSDYSDSEGDNLFLERLLHDDLTPLSDIPYPTHVTFPFDDHHDLDFTCVVRVFLPFFTYPMTSSFLLSSRSKDTIFDLGISIYHSFMPDVSHRCGTFMKFNVYPNHLNESPMEILSSTYFSMDQ
ncbi:hypothetical protein Tco_0451474 [Tanacetum coccineum]